LGFILIELQTHHNVEGGSNRNFGLVFCAVFLIIALLPLLGDGGVRIWALVIAALFGAVAFLAPGLLTWPNRLWTKFGLLLGAIVAPLVMILVFFIAVTPIALILRLTGGDPLRLKRDPEAESYWIERTDPIGPLKNQF